MATLFESSTPIEYLVRDALINENIAFQEQYRLYTGGRFSEVKYVADFFLENDGNRVIVECDGLRYHTGRKKHEKQLKRDAWLKIHGYIVLHFSTREIVSNMFGVIQTIKYHLNLPCEIPKVIKTTNKIAFPTHKMTRNNAEDLFEVILYCYYTRLPNGVCITYKYKYNARNICSDERIKICHGVPEEMLETTAVYMALLDLKRTVKMKIYFSGTPYRDDFNFVKRFKSLIKKLQRGDEIIKAQSIAWSYVRNSGIYRNNCKEHQKILKELRSRCIQVSNNVEKQKAVFNVPYSKLEFEA